MNSFFEQFPKLPGVYFFKDSQGRVLYIGKAKCLRSRIRSYFSRQNEDWKVRQLLTEHESIHYIVVNSETEALLLEAQLIRDYKPKFNTLLKTGNPYLYILFTSAKNQLERIEIVRNKKKKGKYFGPFLHKRDARAVFDYLIRTFKLALCNKKIENGCLDYHIGRCAGNCRSDFDAENYALRLKLAYHVLSGDAQSFMTLLDAEIQKQVDVLAFEKAAHLHHYREHFETIFNTIQTRFSEQKYAKEVEHVTQDPLLAHMGAEGLAELQSLLGSQKKLRTIDCFDISHFQSTHIVGSCVRFTDGIKDPDGFRKFKIKSLHRQNDYAALQEIVERRYKQGDLPDVILIDGGKGQRNAIKNLFPDIPCLSLAKREETVFSDNHPEGVKLDLATPMGKLLIALRNYTHHFAISYHRSKRTKQTILI